MKELQLTGGYVALVDDEDYERASGYKWRPQILRRKDGSVKKVYARRRIKDKAQLLHRFIIGLDDLQTDIDHEDHNGLNCQRQNLRVATRSQNSRNARKTPLPRSSRFKGVCWYKRYEIWRAQVGAKHLGYFNSELDAALAYDEAVVKQFGEFAQTNFGEAQ